ncbi:MAG: carboxylating nicotinate-nucleotide diphosphorylase, partial [Candidatus Omnitrophica bacterium]|nr:carboxylating nicotinate-nucleotide diphosphorylase [Candidatus Omnitrophota bacterium]
MQTLSRKMVSPIIQLALKEDGAYHDLTSRAIIPPQSRVVARIMARSEGVLAGAPVAAWTFQTFDPSLRCTIQCKEGAVIAPSQTLLTVKGKARSIFSAERSALNLLGHLSGIATQTRRFIQQMSSSSVHLLDTRKTLPGLRILEKYAVRIGGGYNHRMGLSNAILIKTNQIHALRLNRAGRKKAITQAIQMARRHNPKTFIQVEVTDMQEFREALAANPDSILL